jgi:hypothetical protein
MEPFLLILALVASPDVAKRDVPFESLMPGPTDRAAFVGQTGSGKTTLAEYVCSQRPYVVVLDPKGRIAWQGYEIHTRLEKLKESKAPRLIYKPVYEELQDPDVMDLFFQWTFRRGNTALYVDEIYAIARGDVYPFHLGACLTRGREVGVVVYSATQRPARVPQIVFSESEHVYCFKLKLPQDRDRMEEITGLDASSIATLPKHHFYYAPQDGEPAGPLTLRLAA